MISIDTGQLRLEIRVLEKRCDDLKSRNKNVAEVAELEREIGNKKAMLAEFCR